MSRGAIVSFTLFIGVASVAAAGLRKGALEHALAGERYEDVYYLPPAEWLPAFSLGWDEALADLLWIRALIYFSDEFLSQGALAHVFDYTEAMLALDPDFRAVYRWIGTAGIYRPHEVSPEQIRRSVAIMRRGLDRFPDDGELAWAIGASLAFELAPLLTDRREREAVRAEGAEYLMMAARLGAAPEWAVLSNAAILDRIGRADAAARHLEEMYARVNDEGVRARIAAALAAAGRAVAGDVPSGLRIAGERKRDRGAAGWRGGTLKRRGRSQSGTSTRMSRSNDETVLLLAHRPPDRPVLREATSDDSGAHSVRSRT